MDTSRGAPCRRGGLLSGLLSLAMAAWTAWFSVTGQAAAVFGDFSQGAVMAMNSTSAALALTAWACWAAGAVADAGSGRGGS